MGADVLVERDTELASLDALVSAAVERREGSVAVIEGLPVTPNLFFYRCQGAVEIVGAVRVRAGRTGGVARQRRS